MIGEGGVAAHIFPFRCRGYYYDAETGFYYLQSRYYDPSTMRFINADDYELAETLMADPGQLYMYNYCNNNPVMYTDESGQFLDFLFDIIFIVWGIIDLVNDPDNVNNWIALAIDIVFSVIPFVTGGGRVVKLANIADGVSDFSKVTVIGETMTRVKTVSQFVNATDNLYKGYKYYDRLKGVKKVGKILAEIGGKFDNVTWLYGKARKGYTIIDIGIDIARAGRSSSYMIERGFLVVWRTRNLWKFYQVL